MDPALQFLIALVGLVLWLAVLIAFFKLCGRVKAIKDILLTAYNLEDRAGIIVAKTQPRTRQAQHLKDRQRRQLPRVRQRNQRRMQNSPFGLTILKGI